MQGLFVCAIRDSRSRITGVVDQRGVGGLVPVVVVLMFGLAGILPLALRWGRDRGVNGLSTLRPIRRLAGSWALEHHALILAGVAINSFFRRVAKLALQSVAEFP